MIRSSASGQSDEGPVAQFEPEIPSLRQVALGRFDVALGPGQDAWLRSGLASPHRSPNRGIGPSESSSLSLTSWASLAATQRLQSR